MDERYKCASCGTKDASAMLMGMILCPKCYTRMAEPIKYDDIGNF